MTRTHTRTFAGVPEAFRRIQFCAGHRVMGHENKCAHMHGHNYVLFAYARGDDRPGADGIDHIGRVVDFSAIKYSLGAWIDKHWDHGYILHEKDIAGVRALQEFNQTMRAEPGMSDFTQKMHLLPYNPTAENMARFLLEQICPLLFRSDVSIVRIVLFETENCGVDVRMR